MVTIIQPEQIEEVWKSMTMLDDQESMSIVDKLEYTYKYMTFIKMYEL